MKRIEQKFNLLKIRERHLRQISALKHIHKHYGDDCTELIGFHELELGKATWQLKELEAMPEVEREKISFLSIDYV
jgi:hypothetical protein